MADVSAVISFIAIRRALSLVSPVRHCRWCHPSGTGTNGRRWCHLSLSLVSPVRCRWCHPSVAGVTLSLVSPVRHWDNWSPVSPCRWCHPLSLVSPVRHWDNWSPVSPVRHPVTGVTRPALGQLVAGITRLALACHWCHPSGTCRWCPLIGHWCHPSRPDNSCPNTPSLSLFGIAVRLR
jgi:hypothetical protein